MKAGREATARSLKNLETAAAPEVPAAVRDMLRQRAGGAKGVEKVLKWLYDQPGLILPDGAPRKIPAEAPWTSREKTLLAYHWLKEEGLDARLFWQLAYSPADGEPAGESMALGPVLSLSTLGSQKKKDVFYCDLERLPQMGEDSSSLWGRMVYGVTPEVKLEERKVTASSASENRLTSRFDLQLAEDGMLTGTVRISARSGWRHFLFPTKPTSGDLVAVARRLFPQPIRYSDVAFKESARESELLVTLAATQLIKGTEGRNILVALPTLLPDCFKSLVSGPFPCTLTFPFAIDAHFSLSLPISATNVILPPPTEQNRGKIKYADSYKLSRKKALTAEVRMTVGTTAIMDDSAADLNSAIQNWQAFMTRYLPMQLKAK
jgi:hypothetical protein